MRQPKPAGKLGCLDEGWLWLTRYLRRDSPPRRAKGGAHSGPSRLHASRDALPRGPSRRDASPLRTREGRELGGCAACVLEPFLELARSQSVRCKLSQVRPRFLALQRLERGDREAMKPHTTHQRHAVVERVSDQDVRESQPRRAGRDLADDAFEDCLVENVEKFLLGERGHVRDDVDSKLSPEHRSEDEKAVAVGGQATKATRDHVAYRLGNCDVGVSDVWRRPSDASSRTISPTKSGFPSSRRESRRRARRLPPLPRSAR